jgi:hypothetical protein
MTGEKVARLTGKDGEPIWVTYDRDYLEGEFDFEVVGGSTQPNNDSLRKQTALQIMDAMAPLAGAGVVNMQELAAYVLQFGFSIKNPEKFLAQPQQQAPQGPQAPPQGSVPAPMPPQSAPAPAGDLPPEIMAALQQQMPPAGM